MMTPEQIALIAQRSAAQRAGLASEETHGYEILFDSDVQPADCASRTSVTASRQLLFRIGGVFVDVEVGRETDSNTASLVGQILDSSNPGHPPAGVPVALVDGGRQIAAGESNDHGEFRFQFVMKRNLKLSVRVGREKPVFLSITDPTGTKAGSDSDPDKSDALRGIARPVAAQ